MTYTVEVRYSDSVSHLPTRDDRERYLAVNIERFPDAVERWNRYYNLMNEKYGDYIEWQPIASFPYKRDAMSYVSRHQGDGGGRLRVVEKVNLSLPYKIYGNTHPIGVSFAYFVEANAWIEQRHEPWLDIPLRVISTG